MREPSPRVPALWTCRSLLSLPPPGQTEPTEAVSTVQRRRLNHRLVTAPASEG